MIFWDKQTGFEKVKNLVWPLFHKMDFVEPTGFWEPELLPFLTDKLILVEFHFFVFYYNLSLKFVEIVLIDLLIKIRYTRN